MRTQGYKCYNIKCGSCMGKTLCGAEGDSALSCVDRLVNTMTNADRIRAMSDEEFAEMFAPNMCPYLDDDCTRLGCKECILEWLKQPYKEDA